jgi:cell division protein FtsB
MLSKLKKFKRGKLFKKGKLFKLNFEIVFLVIAVFLLFGLIILNFKIAEKRKELENKIFTLQKEIQKIEEEKTRYQEKVSELEKQEYWEKELREKFGYKKPNEEVIGFVLPPSSSSEKKNVQPQNFWENLVKKIKDYYNIISNPSFIKEGFQNLKNLL